jgi:UDP-N-acetylmuramate dehydrogenase
MITKEHESLASHTTFRIGGKARYFFVAETANEIRDAVLFAEEKKLPFFVLGGGSNLLFQDADYEGVVIKVGIRGFRFEKNGDVVKIFAGAGESWEYLVSMVVGGSLWGIENLSFIPGSVGGAAVQNVGAYGSELKDCLESVEVFDTNILTTYTISKDDCKLGYRDSIFKKPEGKNLIITGITLRLSRVGMPNLSYKDVKEYFSGHIGSPSLQEMRIAIVAIRSKKLPDVALIGTAGSFFKNPVITKSEYETLRTRFPECPGIAVGTDLIKVPAGWLLDKVGNFKGMRVGGAKVSDTQALIILNDSSATAKDVRMLAESMQKKIFEETKIKLEPEVVIFGT